MDDVGSLIWLTRINATTWTWPMADRQMTFVHLLVLWGAWGYRIVPLDYPTTISQGDSMTISL